MILYLDCGMGAAGDMLSAALLELFDNPKEILLQLNAMGIPHVTYSPVPTEKQGIRGTRMQVLISGQEEDCHHHHHTHLEDIRHIISHLSAPDAVKADVLSVYDLLAQAESKAHGVTVEQIHFHEVGTLDAIADIAAVCYLIHLLAPDEIIASAIHVGSGAVRCAHGILPVPAPATANLLLGIPTYSSDITGELCTPTGAALLKHFVREFRSQPLMAVTAIGYGMGKKDFPRANCVRALWGSAQAPEEAVVELSCNLDDMTPEAIGFAMGLMLEQGALDVYTMPIGMKKSRPGTMLCCLCRPEQEQTMTRLLLLHTTTWGVRAQTLRRHTLPLQTETIQTQFGPIRRKSSGEKRKWEYEDLKKIAQRENLPLDAILRQINQNNV